MSEYDVIIIGSGPGGYVSAIRAAQLGMKTAIVEKESLGGVCLNWGCIPTKALLRSAEILHLTKHAQEFGVETNAPSFNLSHAVDRSRSVAQRLSDGISHLMRKNKITVISGQAKLEKGSTAPIVNVTAGNNTQKYNAKHVILATGARARELANIGLTADEKNILTYRGALIQKAIPKNMLIVGSGAIGIEFASFYKEAGSDVTVIEQLDQILPAEDKEIATLARKAFEKRGIEFLTEATISSAEINKKGTLVSIKQANGTIIQKQVDTILLAVGIVANSDGLGLEELGVQIENTHVIVNGFGQTNIPGLYAIGDLTGAPWLAHKASHEGIICVEKIAGLPASHPFKTDNIPGCTYSNPQIASIGLTENGAKNAGYEINVGRFPFVGNGKAIALGDDNGLIKTIFDKKSGALLGAHLIGPEVTEIIQGFVIAREGEMTEAELMTTIFPHPTLSEAMHESVLEAYNRPIHI